MVRVNARRGVLAIAGCAEDVGWRCAHCPGEGCIADTVLAVCGALFVDLDVIWLGRQMPRLVSILPSSLPDVVLQTEPDRGACYSRLSALAFDGKDSDYHRGAIALPVMFCNPGEASVARAAVALKRFWLKAASQGHVTKKPWMSSVKVFLNALILPPNRLRDQVVDPLVWCPLALWLTK